MTSAQFPASRSRSRPAQTKGTYSRLARAAIALAVCAALDPAYAQVGANTLPTGPKVNAGAATVGTSGNKMTVHQTTPKVSLGWESFSIGSKASVTFEQPSSKSVALNRVVGSDPSWIFGSLSANGKVFLINQAGVVFMPGARVNVGGIAASALDMSDSDFMAGRYVFSGDSSASVVNRGAIITAPGGFAALIGNNVSNEGSISAPGGSVALAAGSRVSMDLAGDGLLSISVDAAAVRAMASNTGLIQADGGRVIVSARAADALAGTVLNQTGIIEARSASMRNGEIVLDGGTGAVNVAGTLDASGTSSGQGGGSIAIRGGDISNAGTLRANAGDNATAGSINVVAGGNLTLEGTSRIEARGANVMSQGGNVYLYGSGNATAQAGQVIDISGGTTSGDGGSAELSAGNHGSFAGTILGRAAEGYRMGTFLIDPVSASVSGAIGANTVVQAEDNITVTGNVTIAGGITLTLLADHTDGSTTVGTTWDTVGGDGSTPGLGTITRTGASTIQGGAGSNLIMAAGGSGVADGYAIGTAATPLLIDMGGGSNLQVFTNNPGQSGGGHTNISNTGAVLVTVVNSGLNANNFNLLSSGNITIQGGGITTGGNVALTTTVGGSIVNGGGVIAAPAVSLTASGSIGSGSPILLATPSITLDAQGDARVTSSVAIANLSLSVNPATGGVQTYTVTDTDTTPGLLSFNVTDNGGNLLINSLTRNSPNNVNFSVTSQTGNIQLANSAIDAGSGSVALTATTGSILDNDVGSDAAPNITTTGALTLIAQGAGASIGGPAANADVDISGVTNVTLRTNNNGFVTSDTTPTSLSITADPTLGVVNYLVNLNGVTTTITDDASNNLLLSGVVSGSPLDFSLTAPAGNIRVQDGGINLSGIASNVVLTAAAGAVTDQSTNTSIILTDPTSTLTLSAATGIGQTGAGNEINTQVPLISLTASGGPINLSNTGSLTVTAFTNSGSGATSIVTTGTTGPNALTIAANMVQSGAILLSAGESTADAGDHLTVNSGITVQSNGGSVILAAGDNVVLSANSVIQSTAGLINITAGAGDNDGLGAISMGSPSTVTAGTTATLTAIEDITVSSLSAGTTVSITSSAGNIFDDANDTSVIVAPSVSLSAVGGSIGSAASPDQIDTQTASLTVNVGGDLYLDNTITTLSSLNLTLRPDSTRTYALTSPGITTFTVTDTTDLNVLSVAAAGGNNLALSLTNASASDVFITNIATNTGAATVVATGGNMTLNTGGTILSGPATLTASGLLQLDGNITSTGASLTGDGVTQTNTSTVNAGTGDILVDATTGTATIDGALTTTSASATAVRVLATTGISQAATGSISSAGDILLDTGAGGSVSLNGSVATTASSATAVSIIGAGVTQGAASTINGGSGSILIDANDGAVSMLGLTTTTSAAATAVRIIDANSAALGNITALNGTVTLGGATTDNISGNLTQAGTLIRASAITGNVGGQTNLISLNEIGTLGAFASGTHFQLVDNNDAASAHNTGLTVTGPVTTVNGGNTTANTANIEISVITNANDNAGTINLFVDSITAHTAQAAQALKTGDIKLNAINVGGTANILEAGAGDGGIDITGNVISFNATNDVGATAGAGKIEIQSNSFNIISGGLGEVAQTGNVLLGSIVLQGDFNFSASGTITVGSPIVVNGNTLIQATGASSNIIVQNNITRTNDAGGSFALEADNHIIFRNGADFIASTVSAGGSGATAVRINSDHDAAGGGAIYIGANSVLHSNNGSITFGGGSGAAANAIGKNETVVAVENYDMSNGIVLEGALSAGGGVVTLRGQSRTGASGVAGIVVRDTGVVAGPGDVVTLTAPVFINGVAVVDADGGLAGVQSSFTGGGDIATTTGNITLLGTGDQGTGNTQGVLITATNPLTGGTTVTTVSGIVNIGGNHVSPAPGGTNVGVLVNNGAVISSTDTANTAGAVTIAGAGASGAGNSDNGVVITSAGTSGLVRTTVSVDGAALNLVGVGGGGGGADSSNVGVQLLGGADVKSIGTGKVTLTGTGGATNGGGNLGIQISGENLALSDAVKNTVVRSTSAAATALRVDLAGTGGAGTGAGDGGILIGSNARVLTSTGNVAMTGVGGAGSSGGVTGNNNFGVEIASTARVTTTSSGSIAVTGTGGLSNDGSNYGIKVTSGGVVESLQIAAGAGTISFTGTGGAGSGPSDTGIFIDGALSKVSTTVGNIVLTGTGGGGATSGTDAANYGIHVSNTAVVETLGAAQVTLDGTGSATANGGNNFGVWIDLAGVVRSTGGAQTGTAGKITILGQGGLGTGLLDGGIGMATGGKVTTLDAEIEFQGFGGTDTTGAGQSHGIFVNGGQILTTGDGAILLTGVGGTSAGGSNHGIFTLGGALIESTTDNALNPPAGTISFDGTAGVGAGGNNVGVAITGSSIVRSKDGFIDIFGTAATAGASAGNVGVLAATDALINSTGLATIHIDGFGSTTGTGTAYGIQVASGAGITSTGTGTITLQGVGGGTTSGGSDNYGLFVTGTGTLDTRITSVTGNIALTGTGGGTGAAATNYGVLVSAEADIATTGAAKIDITGTSGSTSGATNVGVKITGTDTTVTSSGTATSDIAVIGTALGTGTGAVGVVVDSNALVTTTGAGDIAITGLGSTAGVGSAYGIQVDTGAGIVSNTGVGKITLTGTGGSTAGSGNDNYGVLINGTGTLDTRVTSVSGNIVITGTGGGAGATTGNTGVVVSGEADIATTGAASVAITGTSGATSGAGNVGVVITGTDTTVATSGAPATSDITIIGTALGTGTGAVGVVVNSNALVTTTGAGEIAITGTGSASGTGTAYGIQVDTGAGIVSNTGIGPITLTGFGGGTAGSGNDNYGVSINGTGTLDTRVTSVAGNILINGTGGGTGATTGNIGVRISGEADVATTGAASVVVNGTSGITSGLNNIGVQITGADTRVTSSGTATSDVTITGTGLGTGAAAAGVVVDAGALVLTSGAGDIVVTGVGSTTGTGSVDGVLVNSASIISNTSTGKITVTGSGGGTVSGNVSNVGVNIANGSQVTSVTGDIRLDGTGGGTGAATLNVGVIVSTGSDVLTTGAAKVDIIGQGGVTSGAGNYGVWITGVGTTVDSSGTATSDITINGTGRGTGLVADGVHLDAGALVRTTGAGDIAVTGVGSTTGTGVAIGVQLDSASIVSNTSTGKITLTGTGGGITGSGPSNYGILASNAQVTSVTGDISVNGTGGGTGASTDNIGVFVGGGSDVVTTGAAKVDIVGLSGITSGTNNVGVRIANTGTTVASSGTATSDITINGTGRGTGTSAIGVAINDSALVTTTGAGDIVIIGGGSTTGTATAYGVHVDNASVTSNTGVGKITLTGTGGGTAGSGDNNFGAYVVNNAQIITVAGDIQVTGTGGGTGAANSNTGVLVEAGSDIVTTGAGKIGVTGTSGATSGTNNFGVQIANTGTTVSSSGTATSDIAILGTALGTGTGAVGVMATNNALVTTTGAGDIVITGIGSTTGTGNAYGVQLENGAGVTSNTGVGKITLTGTGGGTAGSGDFNYGVLINGTGTLDTRVTTVAGDILINGTGGGTGAAQENIGIQVSTGADIATTGAAKVDIIGQSGITSGANNYGVLLSGAGTTVTSSGTATSDIAINGTGRGTGLAANGVLMNGTAQVLTTGAGDIAVTGLGSATSFGNTSGIAVDNASIVSNTGAGLITLTGTGGGTTGTGDQNLGVSLVNSAQVSSVTGNIAMTGAGGGTGISIDNVGVQVASGSDITTTGAATTTITGTGGFGNGTGNHGVRVTAAGTTVTSTSSAIALTGTGGGTGGNSVGVLVDGGGLVGTATGSVTLTGTGVTAGATNFGVSLAGGTVEATSSGSVALIGTGGTGAADISAAGGGNTIGNAGMTGELLLRSLGAVGTVSDATILTSGSAGIVTLNAQGGGGFNQTGGTLVSDSLRFLGSGTFTLLQPGNAVNKMAGTLAATSTVDYTQAGTLEVASLTSFQDGVGINQTTSNGLDIAGASSVLNLTAGGFTQTAPIVMPGTTTLTAGANAIVLNDGDNSFGTINVPSATNVTLGGTSIGLGDVTPSGNLTINADTLTDSGTVIVPGLATFNVTGDMVLDSPASNFSSVTFNVGGNASLTDVNELVVNTSFVDGLLTLITGGALTDNGIISAGAVNFTVTSGGVGTLANPFSLNTDGDITLTITGTVSGSPAAGFVTNAGSGLLVLLPPTGLVQFQIVEFQPPTPATAAMYISKEYAFVPLEEITDLLYVTDDPAEQEYPGVRGRIGRLPNGTNIFRDGGIRMPPGLTQTGGSQPAQDMGFEPLRGSRFLIRN